MASAEVVRWNVGLAAFFVAIVVGFLAKLKFDADAGIKMSRIEEESNLIKLVLMINAATVLYWLAWPCPYKFSNPIARNQSVTTRVETLIRIKSSKISVKKTKPVFTEEPRTFEALKAQNELLF